MKKSLRILIRENCGGSQWIPMLCDNRKNLGRTAYKDKKAAIKRAKFLSKITDIPYDPEIIKEHRC
jgi:hypothetical protein